MKFRKYEGKSVGSEISIDFSLKVQCKFCKINKTFVAKSLKINACINPIKDLF